MAFLGYSEDFDLDDDGILRDSTELEEEVEEVEEGEESGHWLDLITNKDMEDEGEDVEDGGHWLDFITDKDTGGILIDDDGIVRDDFDLLSKHGSSTHWTDSGLGGDKPASTPSTLRQLDFQSYPSFEDVSRNFDESTVNISDLEASKDDLSFDDDYDHGQSRDKDFYDDVSPHKGNRSGLSSRSSFDHSLNYDESVTERESKDPQSDLFGEEYYRQLQELGVLVDENDFINPRESLQEFESLEHHYSRDFESEDIKAGDAIEDFLKGDRRSPTRDSMDIEMPDDRNESKSGIFEDSHGFDNYYHREFVNEGEKRTRPNTASSTRTISSRSFPEISPEEALELYGERANTDGDNWSIQFEQTQSQRTDQFDDEEDEDEDEIYFVPSQDHDGESPKPAKIPAYDIENKPSMTPKHRGSRSDRSRSDRSRSDRSRSDRSSDGSRSVTPQSQSQYIDHEESDENRSVTPQPAFEHGGENGYHSNEDRNDSLTQVTRLDSRNITRSESENFRPDSALSELSSAASESRAVRPKTQRVTAKPPKQKSNLSHAKSEESFFNMESMGPNKVEKGPKRLLPKPAPGEENQSFKVKSKSTTNIAALGGPVKPTHMSLSEIRNIAIDDDLEFHDQSEPKSQASDVPKGELTKKLKQESSKRQQATQLVKQLQEDYDKLLSKYALAELTIDQMRLGSKITLHANSPTPSQATSGSLQSAQHLQMLQLSTPQRGMVAQSPQQATPTMFFPEAFVPPSEDGRQMQQRGTSPAVLPRSDSITSMDSTSTPRGEVEQPGGIANDAEKVKLGLLFQARNLDERMQSFQSLLGENHLNVEEQEGVFDKIRTEHEKLRSDYLQSKEDYNVLRRSTPAAADLNFDQEKELEGELFKLGMKFDEIQENVEENLKQKSSARQPFQKKRHDSSDSGADSLEADPSTENMKKKMQDVKAGADMLKPKTDTEFDKKVKRLHEEYNALMDRYKRLKDMGQTRDRDKEIDNLVRKLTNICDEEPEVFKLPPDLRDRAQQLRATQQAKAERSNMSTSKPSGSDKRRLPDPKPSKLGSAKAPAKSYEIITASESWSLAESMDRWERSKQVDQPGQEMSRSRSRDNLNTSVGSSRSFRNDYDNGRPSSANRNRNEPDSGLKGKQRSGSYSSLSSRGRHTPDSGRGRHSPDSGRGRHSPDSARGRHTPDSGRGRHTPDSSYNDRDSPVPSLPRPRRHDYPDRERRERRDLKKSPDLLGESTTSSIATDSGIASLYTPKFRHKRPEGGSTTSLQDSGISEHEGGATGMSGPNSPLSKLPGPGKFKQMTGRRELDTDSGFIGSMVGSEVSAGNLSSRRQPPAQSPLRLRHPGDVPGRPSSRQSNRSDDSARATTPRSARSQASSKSSRRTPTKAFPLPETKQQESKTEARNKTPTRDGNRSRSRDQVTQHSQDYTDDSYTTVTESEVSFDSDMRLRRRHSHGSRHNTSNRQIDKIAEDSEEDQFSVDPTLNETTDINLSWVTSDSERPSVKHSRRQEAPQQTLKKPQETLAKTSKRPAESKPQPRSRQSQGRSSRQTTDDDTTSTLSPTRDTTRDLSQDTTQDTYTSDETTPRSVIERERRVAKQKSTPSAQHTEQKKPPSPSPEVPPPRTITPVKVSRSEAHPKKFFRTQEQGPVIKAPERSDFPPGPKYMDRSIGSVADETILASDAETAVTRGSVNSQRLKMLSSEIEKLREEFVKANHDKQQQPQPAPPPPPPQPQQPQYYDQYFDPTEDPLAFMRGPRRRANSFSGHGERNWDYDWMYGAARDGDIPLGYAAADAYATPRQRTDQRDDVQAEEDPTRSRGRRRLRRRIDQRNTGTQHIPQQNGYDSDQSPTRGTKEEASAMVTGHYGYYSPKTTQPVTQSPSLQPPPAGSLQQGRRVFGSQPNLQYFGYQPPATTHSTGSESTSSRPLRQTLYSYAANPNQNHPATQPPSYQSPNQRQYANDDIYVNDGQTRFIPNGATDVHSVQSDGGVRRDQGVYTSTCPLCGSTSSHTHGDFVFPPADTRVPVGYLVHDGRDVVENVMVPVYAQPDPQVETPHFVYTPQSNLILPNKPSVQFVTQPPPPPATPPPSKPPAQFQAVVLSPNMTPPPQASPTFQMAPPPPPLAPPPTRPPAYFQTVVPTPSVAPPTSKPPLPVRVYKAPPRLKPRFFSFRLPDKLRVPAYVPAQAPPTKPRPMAANHDISPQPFLKLVETTQKEGRQPRARSRSWGRMGRIRHYSPDGRIRSRYFVREFGGVESDSAESETEEMPRASRSRSVGRRKIRHGRKYRHVKGEDYDDEDGHSRLPERKSEIKEEVVTQSETENEAQQMGDNSQPPVSAAGEADLNRSLQLVGEIDQLTHRMIGTVGEELAKAKRSKDFGSSYW